MDRSVLEEKSSFKMLGLTFSSKLDWGSYVIPIAKTASKKIGALIYSMKFLSPEVALYLSELCICISLISYKNEYAELLVLHLLPLLNHWHIIKTYPAIILVDVHLNWLHFFHFLILGGGLLIILIDSMIFLSPFQYVTRMSMSTISFLAQLDSGILRLQHDFLWPMI